MPTSFLPYNYNGSPEVGVQYVRINLVQLLCDRPWGRGKVKLRGTSKPSLHLNILIVNATSSATMWQGLASDNSVHLSRLFAHDNCN